MRALLAVVRRYRARRRARKVMTRLLKTLGFAADEIASMPTDTSYERELRAREYMRLVHDSHR